MKSTVCLAALCIVFFFTTCGDPPKATNLLVLGNSITYTPPNSRGWSGNWGMAAPSATDDFSHLTASWLNVPLTVMNSAIETDPQGTIPQIPAIASQVGPGTVVVLEFGDDVPTGEKALAAFGQAYDQLAAAVSKGNKLVCVSTWWEKPDVDSVIEEACGAHGGGYAFIGDLFTDPANTDLLTVQFSNPRIDSHPRLWGHHNIAIRVLLKIRGL